MHSLERRKNPWKADTRSELPRPASSLSEKGTLWVGAP